MSSSTFLLKHEKKTVKMHKMRTRTNLLKSLSRSKFGTKYVNTIKLSFGSLCTGFLNSETRSTLVYQSNTKTLETPYHCTFSQNLIAYFSVVLVPLVRKEQHFQFQLTIYHWVLHSILCELLPILSSLHEN